VHIKIINNDAPYPNVCGIHNLYPIVVFLNTVTHCVPFLSTSQVGLLQFLFKIFSFHVKECMFLIKSVLSCCPSGIVTLLLPFISFCINFDIDIDFPHFVEPSSCIVL
jgi:hypothetical protein